MRGGFVYCTLIEMSPWPPQLIWQHEVVMRTRLGISSLTNSEYIMSIRLLTTPDASVPGMSQCSQPWVCEIIETELPVPPTGNPLFQRVDQWLDLVERTQHEFDIAARREADMPFGELVADVAELADREDVHLALGAGAHRPHFVSGLDDVMEHAWPGRSCQAQAP